MKASSFVPHWGVAVACLSFHAHAQLRYEVVELGLPSGRYYELLGMNAGGTIVGFASPPGTAFVRDANGVRFLGPAPGGVNSSGYDINDSGWVVGYSGGHVPDPPFVGAQWAMIDRGSGPELLPRRAGSRGSQAFAINNAGQVAGMSAEPESFIFHPIIWEGEGSRLLPTTPTAPGGAAYDINESGAAAGYVFHEYYRIAPAIWIQDELVVLPDLGGSDGRASAINVAGDAVGYCVTPAGDSVACLWRNMELIELLSGATTSRAIDINNAGWIIGSMSTGAVTSSFLSDGETVWDLNDLLDDPDVVVENVSDIDESGHILARARIDGAVRNVVLDPIPAPAAVTVLSLCLARASRRSRQDER